MPEPFPEPTLDPYANLSLSYQRLMAENSRVVLSGNGGDEVLRLPALPYLRFLYRHHGPFSVLFTVGRYMISQRKLPALGAGIRTRFLRLFGKKSYAPPFPPWLTPDFQRRLDLPNRWLSMNSRNPSSHPFNPRAYSSLNDLFVASLLESFDATFTGCALESRNPFLDRRLSGFLLRIPLIPWSMDKYLLRRSQIGILPDEIRLRQKAPVMQDVMLLHASSGRWNPPQVEPAEGRIRELVDFKLLISYLKDLANESLYLHLRPISLAYWLKITNSG
jgi:asparagine synthetase B (glutamine-hydrolysing)